MVRLILFGWRRVNDSKYGLQAGVFTHDMDKAWHAFEHLEVGGVVWNHVPSIRVDAQVTTSFLQGLEGPLRNSVTDAGLLLSITSMKCSVESWSICNQPA